MSNQNIGPSTWGPVVWHALHYITLGYPNSPTDEQKEKYKIFFSLLADVLPCSICAEHFSEILKNLPLSENVLKNRENLIKWLIDFHNVVNEKNNKPIILYKDALQMIYKNTECKHNIVYKKKDLNKDYNYNLFNINNIFYLFVLLLLIILITLLYKKSV